MKICSKCRQDKLIEQFSINKKYKDGRNCWCKDCRRVYIREWQSEWRKKNPEKAHNNITKWRENNPDKVKSNGLKSRYGITLEEYDKMFQQQDGVCIICGKSETCKNQYGIKRLSVDHRHLDGKVRSLLCNRCNRLVGKIENNLELVRKCIKYLNQ